MTEYIIRFTDVDGTSFNSRYSGEDREDALAWINDKLNKYAYLVKGVIAEVITISEPVATEPKRSCEPVILWDCDVPDMPIYYALKWRLALLRRTRCLSQAEDEEQLKYLIRNNLKTSSLVTRRHTTRGAIEYQKFLNACSGRRGSFDRIAFKKAGGARTTFIDSLVTKRREALVYEEDLECTNRI